MMASFGSLYAADSCSGAWFAVHSDMHHWRGAARRAMPVLSLCMAMDGAAEIEGWLHRAPNVTVDCLEVCLSAGTVAGGATQNSMLRFHFENSMNCAVSLQTPRTEMNIWYPQGKKVFPRQQVHGSRFFVNLPPPSFTRDLPFTLFGGLCTFLKV